LCFTQIAIHSETSVQLGFFLQILIAMAKKKICSPFMSHFLSDVDSPFTINNLHRLQNRHRVQILQCNVNLKKCKTNCASLLCLYVHPILKFETHYLTKISVQILSLKFLSQTCNHILINTVYQLTWLIKEIFKS
jgi:hypothetical protein